MPSDPATGPALLRLAAGLIYGACGAAMSLLLNILGASFVRIEPLEIIRVYLTLPLGEKAFALHTGITLSLGVLLYMVTGAVLGSVLFLMMRRFFDRRAFADRVLMMSALCALMWLLNYYVLLSWVQPLLAGGRWIATTVPWWIGLLSHFALGWTIVVLDSREIFASAWSRAHRDPERSAAA